MMADDVTLRECPRCGCKHEPRETRDEKGHYMRECPRCRWRTGRYHTSKGAVFGWNNEEPLPDPAMAAAQEALRTCGIGGIYDDFQDVADAISQMALYIKEQDARIAELEGLIKPFPGTEICDICGRAMGIGFHVDDETWRQLSPFGDENGVLCPWCADKRAKELGMSDVPATFFVAFDVLRDNPMPHEAACQQHIAELEARGEGTRLLLASLSEGLSMIGTCGECLHYQAGLCEMRGEPVGEYTLALRRGTDLRTCFEEQHEEGA